MNSYLITDSNGNTRRAQAETLHRDADWIMLTKSMPQMEMRRIEKPRDPTKPDSQPTLENIMVSTGRVIQTPVAYFYKPISVELLGEASAAPEAD